ncbi:MULTISPECIES: hypothetical protein [Sphingobacterium]|uniref:hypothetical protein n=1 Tax=Sphingobacterium TaxID=28453 RepID=UPI0013DC4922|nr:MULTISPECIES: hypothetical protein [unclassified Sphingobacterium]
MRIELRHKYLSKTRYNRYQQATQYNLLKAKQLYNANIRLAQAFHPLLTQFEVVLRNSIHRVLTIHFNDGNWVLNQKNGFMSHPSLSKSRYFLKESILSSEKKFHRRKLSITSARLLADQTLGFWTSFFLSHHYALLSGCPMRAFPNKLSTENRATIHSKLEKLKDFRNRINHCEPICFKGTVIDCSIAEDIHLTLYELISWLDPKITPFFSSIDNVPNKIRQIKSI